MTNLTDCNESLEALLSWLCFLSYGRLLYIKRTLKSTRDQLLHLHGFSLGLNSSVLTSSSWPGLECHTTVSFLWFPGKSFWFYFTFLASLRKLLIFLLLSKSFVKLPQLIGYNLSGPWSSPIVLHNTTLLNSILWQQLAEHSYQNKKLNILFIYTTLLTNAM